MILLLSNSSALRRPQLVVRPDGRLFRALCCAIAFLIVGSPAHSQVPPSPAAAGSPSVSISSKGGTDPLRWWKGNLHTHTLWSDGDDFPEMVVDAYKKGGYHFLVLSDHNIMQEGEKWVTLGTNKTSAIALQKYIERFPAVANELRSRDGTEVVRLKTLHEFRPTFDESDHFLLMTGEEISARAGTIPI